MAAIGASEMIADYLVREGVPYAVGIPGHGILTLVDALLDRQDEIKTLMVRHEQAAVHLADGYCRASGQPLVVFTSVGPGAVNTLVGVATAMADSIPVIVITGNCQTYFFDRGAIQDIGHHHTADFTTMMRPVVKRSWQVNHARELPDVLQRAFRLAMAGRPGPVHIELPMDVQADVVDAEVPDPRLYRPFSRIPGDPAAIERAADVLLEAKRPVLLVGGGVILSDACTELLELVEHLGVPVITSTQGKGAIPEDHSLNVFYTGPKGTACATEIARTADVAMALGFRFAEWAAGSYKPGEVFNIPPTRVIQIDIDPMEIGKNYPVTVGILGDLKAALTQLNQALQRRGGPRDYRSTAYFEEIQRLRQEWLETLAEEQSSDAIPITTSRALGELRTALPRDTIVASSSGHTQGHVYQEFPVYEPRTHLSAGGFSTMGWTVPACIGAKLAAPHRVVAGILGDGDFLMTCQELATAVQYNVPVLYCIFNNGGYLSIRDMQASLFGTDRVIATEPIRADSGDWYFVDFVKLAESFGACAEAIETPTEIEGAVQRAIASNRPAVLDIRVATRFPDSANRLGRWADFPMPAQPAAARVSP